MRSVVTMAHPTEGFQALYVARDEADARSFVARRVREYAGPRMIKDVNPTHVRVTRADGCEVDYFIHLAVPAACDCPHTTHTGPHPRPPAEGGAMHEMTYTPGPWRWSTTAGKNGGNRSRMLHGPARRILIVKPGTIVPDAATESLIAAAPDLLAACEMLLSSRVTSDAARQAERSDAAIEMARAAIAKVRGQV